MELSEPELRHLGCSLTGVRNCVIADLAVSRFITLDEYLNEAFDKEDLPTPRSLASSLPDLAIDPDTSILSVLNPSHRTRTVFVSVRRPKLTTYVVVVPPRTVADVARVRTTDIASHISEAPVLPLLPADAALTAPLVKLPCFPFAFAASGAHGGDGSGCDRHPDLDPSDLLSTTASSTQPSPSAKKKKKKKKKAAVGAASDTVSRPAGRSSRHRLGEAAPADPSDVAAPVPPAAAVAGGGLVHQCLQSFGGRLTHFHPNTYHAVDLFAAVGTPVVAVADGDVVAFCDSNGHGSADVSSLFAWNYITLRVRRDAIAVDRAGAPVETEATLDRALCSFGGVSLRPAGEDPHVPPVCVANVRFKRTLRRKDGGSGGATSSAGNTLRRKDGGSGGATSSAGNTSRRKDGGSGGATSSAGNTSSIRKKAKDLETPEPFTFGFDEEDGVSGDGGECVAPSPWVDASSVTPGDSTVNAPVNVVDQSDMMANTTKEDPGESARYYYVDYVHIQGGSVSQQIRNAVLPFAVRAGEVLGESGASGFCPAPHLHLQVNSTDSEDALTVPFGFSRDSVIEWAPNDEEADCANMQRDIVVPRATHWYQAAAAASAAPSSCARAS